MAVALRRRGYHVRGYDADPGALEAAIELDLINEPCRDPESCVAEADTIVLAMPVTAILSALPSVDAAAPPSAMIMDTGSVKAPIVEAMDRLPGARRAIGAHPVAGNELSGPQAADAQLFVDQPFLLCPSARTDRAITRRAEALARSLGAVPRIVRAARHDQTLARTSHVPQFVSTALALSVVPGDEELAGPGLRDMTRLALSNPIMWRDIACTNSANIADGLRAVGRRLDKVAELIERCDGTEIETLLREGGEASSRIRKVAAV